MHTTWPNVDGRQRENSGGFFRQGSNVVRSEISAKVNLSHIYSCCFNQILYSQSLPTILKFIVVARKTKQETREGCGSQPRPLLEKTS